MAVRRSRGARVRQAAERAVAGARGAPKSRGAAVRQAIQRAAGIATGRGGKKERKAAGKDKEKEAD